MPRTDSPLETTPPSKDAPKPSGRLRFGLLTKLIGFQIRRAQLVIYADFMQRAPVRGLTPGQLAILVFIDHNPELTQQRLCDGIGVEKSTLVVRLHRLAERGLIRRVRSANDRRENILELTDKGKAKLRVMLDFVDEHERQLTEQLSDAERKQLFELLAKIRLPPAR
jgi:DNA-binding MarR family transcriptional regulator